MSHAEAHPVTPELLASEQKKYFTFVNLAFLMTALTGVELILIFLPFSPFLIGATLIGLSLIKFVGVIFWFMHLIYDKAVLTLIFLFGMAISTLTVAALLALLSNHDVDTTLPFYEPRPAGDDAAGGGH